MTDLGIGDVTLPLPPAVVQALEEATREQARAETLRGYGPYVGYEFLRAAIAAHDFRARGVTLAPDEIFVSDGGKSDAANIQELFAQDAVVALMDPAYPVYADANVMAGRSGPADASGRYADFVYLPCTAENDFQPALPDRHVDLIYLCYPNNPTGAVMTRAALRRWVEYAHAHEAVIVYDAAYEAYIRDPEIPRSIYEIEGAHEVAIELRSFSKSAGFTGLRMAYAVVPRAAQGRTAAGATVSLNQLWLRRQSTKSNGPPYVIQRAAAAVYTPEGAKAGAGADRPLHGQCAGDSRGPGSRRPHGLRRAQCALSLDPHAGGPVVLGLLRPAPGRGPRGRRAGVRIRAERRGLFPRHGVRLSGRERPGGQAHRDVPRAIAGPA